MSDRREPGSLIVLFSLGHLSNDWAPSAVWLLTPAIAASLALSPAEVGLLITIHSAGAAAAFLPAGILADRYGRLRVLLPGLILFSIAGAACVFATSFSALIALRVVQGIGASAIGSIR